MTHSYDTCPFLPQMFPEGSIFDLSIQYSEQKLRTIATPSLTFTLPLVFWLHFHCDRNFHARMVHVHGGSGSADGRIRYPQSRGEDPHPIVPLI